MMCFLQRGRQGCVTGGPILPVIWFHGADNLWTGFLGMLTYYRARCDAEGHCFNPQYSLWNMLFYGESSLDAVVWQTIFTALILNFWNREFRKGTLCLESGQASVTPLCDNSLAGSA